MYCMSVVESSARIAGRLMTNTTQAICLRVGVAPLRSASMSNASFATHAPHHQNRNTDVQYTNTTPRSLPAGRPSPEAGTPSPEVSVNLFLRRAHLAVAVRPATSRTWHADARPLYNGAVAAGERRVESG